MLFPYRNIVVLTGAGISAESGIRTFRSEDGLWENHRVEDVATPEGYERNPELVQNFYNDRRRQIEDGSVAPNAAHLALAQLEREHEGKVTIVTQNIDNLHERAGSVNVIHMHGELLKARCCESGQAVDWHGALHTSDRCHCCQIRLQCDLILFGLVRCQLEWMPFIVPFVMQIYLSLLVRRVLCILPLVLFMKRYYKDCTPLS